MRTSGQGINSCITRTRVDYVVPTTREDCDEELVVACDDCRP